MQEIDKKEALISITKSALGAIPFAGSAFTELVFEYNGRLKQNRLNKFIELLSEYFMKNQDVKIENIKTEDFNDLFESVIRKVVSTKSELKLKRFRNILVKELNNPSKETELIDIYLDLISSLSEEELMILSGYSNFDKEYYKKFEMRNDLKTELSKIEEESKSKTINLMDFRPQVEFQETKEKILEINSMKQSVKKYSQASYYKLSEAKFMFYKQRLYSKGLLIDEGMGRMDATAFEKMMITEFGEDFIDFIRFKNNR